MTSASRLIFVSLYSLFDMDTSSGAKDVDAGKLQRRMA